LIGSALGHAPLNLLELGSPLGCFEKRIGKLEGYKNWSDGFPERIRVVPENALEESCLHCDINDLVGEYVDGQDNWIWGASRH
jgi:hypothetical protein